MSLITQILLQFIKIYSYLVSPLFPGSCRFTPTCSAYAKEAIIKWGPYRGVILGIKRILSCNPFGKSGYDPVPDPEKQLNKKPKKA